MPTTNSGPIFITFEGRIHAAHASRAEEFYTTLQPLVTKQPGFISETGFVSVDQEGAQVLYVRFEDEESLGQWRRERTHAGIQRRGREGVFVDYRIRAGREVGEGVKGAVGEVGEGKGRYLLVWQYPGQWKAEGANASSEHMREGVDSGVWQSLTDSATYHNEAHVLRIMAWSSLEAARAVKGSIRRVEGDDLRLIDVERDYGLYQRKEAPDHADRCQAAAVKDDDDTVEE